MCDGLKDAHRTVLVAAHAAIAPEVLPALQAATDPDAQGGDYYGPYGFMEATGATSGRAVATATARDPLLATRLWEVSKDMTGIDPGLPPAA